MKRTWILMLMFIFSVGAVLGQDLQVSGTVTSAEDGEPLPGANIIVLGTTRGTSTDLNGTFSIKVPDVSSATLVISFFGYKSVQEDVSSSNKNISVSLEEDVLKTEEVVITGVATSVKRSALANSVATVSANELLGAPSQTLDAALSGKFAGIKVTQNTGAPGGGMNVNLRGTSTIVGRTQPLYVIDGVIIDNSANQSGIDVVSAATGAGSSRPQGQPTNRIGDVNLADVENIEVLKGASASALYGSKATNGVVIINTKKGNIGRTKIDVSTQYGFNSILNDIGTRKFTAQTALDDFGQQGQDFFNANGNIDHEKILYGESGKLFQTSVSARGGNEKTQFYSSVFFQDDDGIVKNTGYSKYTGKVNLDHRFNAKLKVGVTTSVQRAESDRGITGNDNSGTTFGFALGGTPSFFDLRPTGGVYPTNIYGTSNPVETRDLLENNEVVYRTINSMNLNYSIFQMGNQSLDFIFQGGFDFYSQENQVYSPNELQFERNDLTPGASLLNEVESITYNTYFNLSHLYSTANQIVFRTSTGWQLENLNQNSVLTHADGLVGGQRNVDQGASVATFQNRTIQRDRGFYLQEEVDIQDTYFLTAGFRMDNSSANGDPDKFNFYPKASGSVRVSQYGFWDSYSEMVNELKVRVAYGESGNLPPANAKYESKTKQNIGGQVGLVNLLQKGNPDIEPERTSELEFGVDASFMNDRAGLEFTMFFQTITDLLLEQDIPLSTGSASQFVNGGEMETNGFEVALTLNPFRYRDFRWISRTNYYKTESEITKLTVDPFNIGGFATFLGTYRIQEGWSPTTIVGSEMKADGVTHVKLGDETPDFIMSFANSFTFYKNLELSFLWEWKKGGDIINLGKLITDLGAVSEDYDDLAFFHIDGTGAYDPNASTEMKKGEGRLAVLGNETAPYVEDGSYWKLRELSLSYTFNREAIQNVYSGFSYLRVGLAGRNLLVFADYTGYDPEVSQFGNVPIGGSVDTIPFPSARSIYFNLAFGL